MVQPLLTLFTLFYLYLSRISVHALRNVTIDDTSTAITYYGADWKVVSDDSYNLYGSQHLVDLGTNAGGQSSSFASFTFTGTAIFFWAPLWPFSVTTGVTLDSEPMFDVKLTTNGPTVPVGSVGPSVPSAIRWSRTGLSNTQHTLIISLTPGSRYIVVDALTFTLVEPSDAPPTPGLSSAGINSPLPSGSSASSLSGSTSTSSTGSIATPGHQFASTDISSPSSSSSLPSGSVLPGTTSTSNSNKSNTLAIICISIGSLFALTIAAILFFCLRKRRPREDGTGTVSPYQVDFTPPSTPPPDAIPLGKLKMAKEAPLASSSASVLTVETTPEQIQLFSQFIASLPNTGAQGAAPPPYRPRSAAPPSPPQT